MLHKFPSLPHISRFQATPTQYKSAAILVRRMKLEAKHRSDQNDGIMAGKATISDLRIVKAKRTAQKSFRERRRAKIKMLNVKMIGGTVSNSQREQMNEVLRPLSICQ
jgi:hypothetical protein